MLKTAISDVLILKICFIVGGNTPSKNTFKADTPTTEETTLLQEEDYLGSHLGDSYFHSIFCSDLNTLESKVLLNWGGRFVSLSSHIA